jgi:hypothetical protein
MTRQTLLKKAAVVLVGATVAVVSMPGSAKALTVNFDDLPEAVAPISNGHAGLDWNNFYAFNHEANGPGVTGYENGRVSRQNVAFNAYGTPAEISSSGTFTFNSTYLTGAWNNGLNILVEGFQGGNSLFTRLVTVDSTSPTLFTFDWVGIDRLRFTSSGGVDAGYGGIGNHFAMDNFSFNKSITTVPTPALLPGLIPMSFNKSITTVPTPALLPGLIGMGFTAWRKRKAESKALVSEKM